METLTATASDLGQFGRIRYKPLFISYNSCVDEFKTSFSEEHAKLRLEEMPLYDAQGKERFTAGKLSTVLHQSKAVVAVLKSFSPPADYDGGELPGKVTLSWLSRHVPAKFWVWLLGITLMAFSSGVGIGRFWLGTMGEPTGSAVYPQESQKPELDIYYQSKAITGKTQAIDMSALEATGDIALDGLYVKNVGAGKADNLSLKFYIPQPAGQSVLDYRPGVASIADWRTNESLMEEYPTFLSLPYNISLSPSETWSIPSFDISLANNQVPVVSATLVIFYGGEKPVEADFRFHLLSKQRRNGN